MDFTNGEFRENLARVHNLVTAAKRLEELQTGGLEKEVLRAAVAFLHSTLEEVVRSLYQHKLPNVAPERLNNVPLAGREISPRPKPILLGDLRLHSGKIVENVIVESIDRYVDMLSINNSTQLVQCLELAEISHRGMEPHFASLDLLMKRRHQIVHQMDRTNALDPLSEPINDIDAPTVEAWIASVEAFSNELMSRV